MFQLVQIFLPVFTEKLSDHERPVERGAGLLAFRILLAWRFASVAGETWRTDDGGCEELNPPDAGCWW